ncbi:uncharacterized protein K489DRAFT_175678 [Dissoconium aciculare CBS 342.82]|uniref:Uncharacterized protein n=1 Tax=Dissoconium aciculare CBS 342.82 TaxID=1314786 RepID=A0A6J3M969_9PEZI|nr:uncharacterized protein K489DRAFT_175678 [Dissoconium aciculare CBS 342.82]KAF1824159.1 hypothetical protein K489DRAFT_175678 [Dissoconium aciculare CBS 342.82]
MIYRHSHGGATGRAASTTLRFSPRPWHPRRAPHSPSPSSHDQRRPAGAHRGHGLTTTAADSGQDALQTDQAADEGVVCGEEGSPGSPEFRSEDLGTFTCSWRKRRSVVLVSAHVDVGILRSGWSRIPTSPRPRCGLARRQSTQWRSLTGSMSTAPDRSCVVG